MSKSTQLGLGALGVTLGLAVAYDMLLRATPWGLNFAVCAAALVVAVAGLAFWHRTPLTGGGRWLVVPLLAFAAAMAWRDSATLKLCNLLAVLIALSLAVVRSRAGRVRIAGLVEYGIAAALTGGYALGGAPMLAGGDIRWREASRGRLYDTLLPVGRGLLIAVPLLLLFGCLFMAADAVFEGIVTDIFRIDLADLVTHFFMILVWGWVLAGLFHAALFAREQPSAAGAVPRVMSLGRIEISLVLGLLNALFLAFVIVQIRYLFGGAQMVSVASGLTYAEYARRGFFELVAVSALVLPMLLAGHWLLRPDDAPAQRWFRVLSGLLVLLLFVVMASAVQRMRLYQEAYGLTELRLYTTAFMGWLALVFGWFGATVLAGHRERFAFGALAAGFAVLVGLNALNPDALIARTNAGRTGVAVPFDEVYVMTLSADAVPTLIATLPQLEPDKRAAIANAIREQWSPPARYDWRTWSWGRMQAWYAVVEHDAELQQQSASR